MEFLLRYYTETPPVTKGFCTLCVLVTLSVHMEILSAYDVYFNPKLILYRGQIWRLLSSFFFMGKMDLNFVFNILFAYRHSYYLEFSAFADNIPELLTMWIFGCVTILIMAYATGAAFLNQSILMMLVYIWSRRNPHINIDFLGLLQFPAPYFPMILVGFSFLFNPEWVPEVIGFMAGHSYYHLEFVFPNTHCGFKVLKAPQFLHKLFGRNSELVVYDETTNDVPNTAVITPVEAPETPETNEDPNPDIAPSEENEGHTESDLQD